ncbi:MAG: menaquinol-cytochrome c reductase cytochrome b subunit [bacterium]|nr:menaquinol-cytochrome c reductase cytochrome b subunit [bacterium]MXV91689.1 menaquinol-cytochrome c reductase cytochrome b subunit [Acidimicrobiia bacterium]MYC44330.1 menaquinol-cytochrome c reductase cytochrome b subunit [Acidimicrobiia bacterium]MYI20608.1 menaquinol-cytochrome c reductase cytochrome b subunit [Acidimicrobiia bacterium]
MTEVPEHLLRRAKEARERLEDSGESAESAEAPAGAASAPPPAEPTAAGDEEKIPAHLLDRSRSAEEQAAMAPAAPGGPVAPAPPSLPTGPGGHTQRLLTVVKSGSIQDVKAMPQDRVHVWPHLLLGEFVASLFITAFLLIFSVFVNAPLLELANVNETPNPSKAPWYFLGLQELLTMFHPMVAGVTIPGIALFLLILAPYIDRNKENAPEKRKFAVSLMTVHLMFWAILVMIGSFFRGPGFNFIFPWQDGLFFDF